MKTLKQLEIGKTAVVTSVGGDGSLRQHFLDMGLIPGTEVMVTKYAPMGDPMQIRLHGYELTLRLADAGNIEIGPSETESVRKILKGSGKKAAHPGLGEEGKFHPKGSGDPLPDDVTLTFALVGNQNSGKTTLFNQLTGARQHVGNFPGVTVDRKDGVIRGYSNTLITDLPGIYSMSPYSSEELVSRNFVLKEKPKAIINIVDATNIERNLYLTMQLLEMDVPVVVALNMMDEVTGNGGSIDINRMEDMLGTPVVPISAAKNQGTEELVKHLIEDHAAEAGLPVHFAAAKIVEGDELILDQLDLDQNEKEMLEHIVLQMENERGLDHSAAMADMRFSFITKVCSQCVTKPHETKEHLRSRKIDTVLTGKFSAIPIFIAVMALVFYLTFIVVGPWLQDLLDQGIGALTDFTDGLLTNAGVNSVIHDLVISGIFEGVGSVVSFLPIIVVMFFFLSLLEDSGYIARVAFVMDRILRSLGLSGRSIVPMLIGFGCTVPAVMSTRTLPSERDRRMTILLTPFFSCTAKLPIYGFFISVFFPKYSWLIITGLYILGIFVGVLMALIFKKTLFKGEPVPFVMELPNYRIPSPRTTALLLWEKSKDFLQRAFSVILVATIVVWFLKTFDFRLNVVTDSHQSILAAVSGVLAPLFRPLGMGDWRVVSSLFSGFLAKESVVSVLEVIFDSEEAMMAVLSPLSAAAMLVFSLLYTPCVAAVAAIKRELGGKWAGLVVLWQCTIAWIMAFIVRLIGMIFA